MADITNIVEYYKNLLIIQYNNKQKAQSTIELLTNEFWASGIAQDVRDAYNIDTAIGEQLDILGKYIGVDRFYTSTQLNDDYFGFADATNTGGVSANIVGFDNATSPDKSGLFLSSDAVIGNEFELNDETYRTLLKLKIIQNYSNHSMQSISESLFTFFGDSIIVVDNYDMTITYFIGDASSALVEAAIAKGVLPNLIVTGKHQKK